MTRLELMAPAEIVAARERAPVAFVPVSPLEWHGPHLPLGTDGLHAHHVALRVAERVGGVVLPPLFVGTDGHRDPAMLERLGLPTDADVFGMDFPGFPTRSLYYDESIVEAVVGETVRALQRDGWRLVVLVTGHGAPEHARALERVAGARLVTCAEGDGHAERWETSIVLGLDPSLVHLDRLPDGPLRYAEHGVVDEAAFTGDRSTSGTVESDPRAATREDGERALAAEVERVAVEVRAWL